MHTPDGMGEDTHRERQNMTQSRADTPGFKWDVVAEDPHTGEELFVTESTYTEEQAEEARQQCANARTGSAEVRYKIRER